MNWRTHTEKLSLHVQYQPLLQVNSQIAGKTLDTLKCNMTSYCKISYLLFLDSFLSHKSIDMGNTVDALCVQLL